MARPTSKEQKRLNRHINRICSQVDLGTMTQYLDKSTGVYHGPLDSSGIAVVGGSGGIAAGNFVYIDSYSSGVPVVLKAQANSAATSNDVYFAPSAIAAGASGYVFTNATWQTDTSGASAADAPVYLSDTVEGGWTTTKPTETDIVKVLGSVIVKSATVGYINVNTGDESIIAHDHSDAANGGSLALAEGSLLIGDNSGDAVALDASGDAQIIVGDGTTAASVAVIGDATLANDGSITLATDMKISVNLGIGGEDTDGAGTNGGGILGGSGVDLTTNKYNDGAGTVFVKVNDASDAVNGPIVDLNTASSLDAFTANYQLLPDAASEAAGDSLLIGKATMFSEVVFDDLGTGNGQVATWNADGAKWQYSTGQDTWSDLTVFDNTDATAQDGKRSLQRPGAITFAPPSDWDTATYPLVDGDEGYFIQLVFTAAELTQTALIDDTNKDEPFVALPNADTPTVPHRGSVHTVRVVNLQGTDHNQDVKFCLWNVDQMAYSSELTWASGQKIDTFDISGSPLGFTASGEAIAIQVTDDGGAGTNPFFHVELDMTQS